MHSPPKRWLRRAVHKLPSLSLPGLYDSHLKGPAIEALGDVACAGIAAAGCYPVLEGRPLINDVLHDELKVDVLKIIACRRIARVITAREIEGVIGRLHIVVVVDRAGERAAPRRAARRETLEVDVGRRGLGVEEVGGIIHEADHAPRTVAPPEPRPRFESPQ